MPRNYGLLLPLILLCLTTTSFGQSSGGKLDGFGKEAKKADSASSYHPGSSHESVSSEISEDVLDLLFQVTRAVVLSSSRDTSNIYHTYSQYPYQSVDQGLYKIGGAKDFAASVSLGYFQESARLGGPTLRMRLAPLRWLSGEVYLTGLSERNTTGHDVMVLGSVYANYQLIRQNTWAAWVGVGDKLMRGSANLDGVSFNGALEIYPVAPISLHLDASSGPYSEYQGKINLHISRSAFFVGYQAFTTGAAILDGFIAGGSVFF